MAWSDYIYLAPLALCAAALFALVVRTAPRLCAPSRTMTRDEALVLSLVTALGLAVIYGRFYLGETLFAYSDVGSDTLEQYVPYYLNMLDSVRDGSLGAWNFEYGLGTSFMSYQSWTLDPFNLVLVPLGLLLGDAHLAIALVVVQSLKIVACAFVADRLLSFYCETPLARLVGASLLSFGGYLVLWGQHYWIGSIYVMALVVLLLLELLREKWTVPRFAGLALGTAVSIVMSTYSGFMIMLFAAIYAALRTLHFAAGRGVAGFARMYGALALPVVCGILMAMVTLVPYAMLMLGDSSRVTGGGESALSRAVEYATSFAPASWVPVVLSRLLGSSLISSGEPIPDAVMAPTEQFPYVNVYEIITLGVSGVAIVMIALFLQWTVRRASRRDKVLIFVSAALILLYCFNFFLPTLFNALVNPKYRSSFAVAIPLCIAISFAWERTIVRRDVSPAVLAASVAVSEAVVLWSLANTVNGRLECLAYVVAIAVFGVVVLWGARQGGGAHGRAHARPVALALACLTAVSLVVVDAFFTTNQRSACTADNFPGASQSEGSTDTLEALDYLREKDGSLWRVEKTYSDWTSLDDSLVQGYWGVSSYNSTLDSDLEEFYERLWPGAIVGDIAYQSFAADPNHPELLTMLGVKYVLSHDALDWPWLVLETKIGGVSVYRNAACSSIATMREGVVTEGVANSLATDAERRALLGGAVIVPDESADVLSGLESLSRDELLAAYREFLDAAPTSELSLTNPDGLSFDETLSLNPGYMPLSEASFRLEGPSRLEGAVFASSPSVTSLSIPYTSGWHVLVDGREVETFRANYGFIGLAVPAGTHEVVAYFEPNGLRTGCCLSALGLLAACASCAVGRRLSGRRADGGDASSASCDA